MQGDVWGDARQFVTMMVDSEDELHIEAMLQEHVEQLGRGYEAAMLICRDL